MKTPRRRWMSMSIAIFSTVVAALAMTTSARGVAMEEEERLIGWKGEVASEPRAGAGARMGMPTSGAEMTTTTT